MNAPQTATLAQLQTQTQPRESNLPAVQMGFGSLQSFELMQRGAKLLTSSDLVPQQFRGNLANCVIALNMANRIGADPLMVMQNLYVVHGSPSWSSKFLIATINTCGRFSALRYEWRGEPGTDNYGCRAWAIEKATGERLDGIWVDWKMVKAEGWSSKNGSKWKTMPDQMFVYRAAAFWQRAYAPELGMGLQTAEEMHDVIDINEDGSYRVTSDDLRTAENTVEMPTGGAPPAASDTVVRFSDRIAKCADIDVLDVVLDDIREIEDDEQRNHLTELAKKRRAELAG